MGSQAPGCRITSPLKTLTRRLPGACGPGRSLGRRWRLLAWLACSWLAGCGDSGGLPVDGAAATVAWSVHQQQASKVDQDLRQARQQLLLAADRFLANPAADELKTLQQHWLQMHRAITRLEFLQQHRLVDFRLQRRLRRIDQWPIEPGFLDAVPEYPFSGLINDLTLPLNRSTLEAQHMATDAREATLGLHALEFLLWGREVADFRAVTSLSPEQTADGLQVEQIAANRRRQALHDIVEVIAFDIERVRARINQDVNENPVPPRVDASVRWALKQMVRVLTPDEAGNTHSPYAGYDLEEIRLLARLTLDAYDRDTNFRPLLREADKQAEGAFHEALQQFLAETGAAGHLDQATRERFLALATLAARLFEDLLPAPEAG